MIGIGTYRPPPILTYDESLKRPPNHRQSNSVQSVSEVRVYLVPPDEINQADSLRTAETFLPTVSLVRWEFINLERFVLCAR